MFDREPLRNGEAVFLNCLKHEGNGLGTGGIHEAFVRKSFVGVVVDDRQVAPLNTISVKCIEPQSPEYEKDEIYSVSADLLNRFRPTESFVGFDEQGRRVFDSTTWTGREEEIPAGRQIKDAEASVKNWVRRTLVP